jgi:recombination protein RecT
MNKNAVAEIRLQLDTMVGQFAAVLPKHIPVERFGRVVLTAVQTNPELLNVERRSLWNAAMKAAQDGLLPDGRLGALVVYRDKRRGSIAQWLPMIAGIRQKVRNSGEVATWEVNTVHEKDFFDYQLGDDPHIDHRPMLRGDRGKIIAAYSIATLKTGEKSREVMSIDEIEAIRMQSKAGDGGPWKTFYGEMAKKTVAKRHAKVLPMSSDLDDLLRRDDEENEGGTGSAIQPPPSRSLTDALNMIASLPEGKAVSESDIDENQGDLIEHIGEKETASHGT